MSPKLQPSLLRPRISSTSYTLNSTVSTTFYPQTVLSLSVSSSCDITEKTWNDLQWNLYTEFSINSEPYLRKNIIQDGYLISRSNTDLTRYGYVDLFASPPKEEPHWVHISLKDFQIPYNLVFSVDNDLAVAVREPPPGLSNTNLLSLSLRQAHLTPSQPRILNLSLWLIILESLGSRWNSLAITSSLRQYIQNCRSSVYLVSWKAGTVTFLGALPGALKVTVIDSNFIMLIRESINTLEIHKLELASSPPCMQNVCSLGLPPLKPNASILSSVFSKEWIASSKRRAESQFSRGRLLPFRSSRVDTMTLRLSYHIPEPSIRRSEYAVIFSCHRTSLSGPLGCMQGILEKLGPSRDTYPPLLRRRASASWPFLDHMPPPR
ncbi:hypothetical protein H4582DRAFT_821864 [Lactarius indigo]|nr:hypothetical protein H4582DRAFT_821864 [Lactarius indigo]